VRELEEVVAERVRRVGPIRFDEFMDLALYHPELGFYCRGQGAGRTADFLTSPSVGPLFGAVIAQALDDWWAELGNPDPFTMIEVGAADGRLAADVLAAQPQCAPALRYVLVEVSPALRAVQPKRVRLEPALVALGPVEDVDEDDGPRAVPGLGPMAMSLADLPAEAVVGVVFANELVDNLPFRVVERTASGWSELRVSEDLAEVLVASPSDLAAVAERFAPRARPGSRVPVQHRAGEWLRGARGVLARGRVVVVDYGDTTAGMADREWTTWLRTYAAHGRGGDPLTAIGEQDITSDVAVDQLAAVAAPAADSRQDEFLRAHGLDTMVEAARRAWVDGAATGDLAALRARSRLNEAAALTDLSGLGAFRALEWRVGPSGRRKPRG
jgi:SAM-dependent MidA family methyltransferase